MSELLKPLTRFLESIGIDPIIFAIVVNLIVIYICRDNYLNWKEQSETQKTTLKLFIIGLCSLILAWFVVEFKT